ncbi:MAG: hypothetical protein KAR11_03110 [Phycisphaerae bacterium]|nr:hypothetical protein [Phycisphaerae bacterium]
MQLKNQNHPLGSIFALLGAGIFGTILFIIIVILLSPLLLVLAIWMLIMRYRLKKAFKNMAVDMEDMFNQAPNSPDGVVEVDISTPEGCGERPAKRIESRVVPKES